MTADDGIEGVDWWWSGEGPGETEADACGDPSNAELAEIPADCFGPYDPDDDSITPLGRLLYGVRAVEEDPDPIRPVWLPRDQWPFPPADEGAGARLEDLLEDDDLT